MALIKKEPASEQGVALIMAMLVLMVMSIVIMGMATDADLDLKISRNLKLKNQAFNNAETGIAVAAEIVRQSAMLDLINENNDTNDINLSSNYRIELNSETDLEGLHRDDGEIDIYYNEEENDNESHIANVTVKALNEYGFILRSDGLEQSNTEHTVSALLLPFQPFGNAGMVGCEEVDFTGSAYTAITDILSGGNVNNDDRVDGRVRENAKMQCDPLNMKNMFPYIDPLPKDNSDCKVKDTSDLTNCMFSETENENDTEYYKIEDIDIGGNTSLEIDQNKNVVLYIEEGLEIKGKAEIEIDVDTRLTIYINGKVDIGGTGITNKSQEPENLIIYSLSGSDEDVQVGGTGRFDGGLYAPYADVELFGTSDYYGAVRGKTVENKGDTIFEYDPFFEDWINDYPGGYYLTNWNTLQD